jgi:hypothetical protein
MLSHHNLMTGAITLSSIHLALSSILFIALIAKPNIVRVKYIEYFLYISLIVNIILFGLFIACRNLGTEDTKLHNSLMNTCIALSFIHIMVSFLMLNFTNSDGVLLAFLAASIAINGIIINQSTKCKNLEG